MLTMMVRPVRFDIGVEVSHQRLIIFAFFSPFFPIFTTATMVPHFLVAHQMGIIH